ncbi:MAG: hypothetical protein DIU80_024025 [Chloroflexota bacterium]|nr:MAG: hypothetical protein DIU80_19110 [Chloroflexota bacterium]
MHFRTHLIASAVAGLALYPRSLRRAALVVLGGVGLDADHYLLYATRSGDWSLAGAIAYDRRRHGRVRPGDTRPRYGSLRSAAHRPLLTLPLIWALSLIWPALRPIAVGLTLHLAMDVSIPHYDRRLWRRAGGRCERCGLANVRLAAYYVLPPHRGGDMWALDNRAIWCSECAREHYTEARRAAGPPRS